MNKSKGLNKRYILLQGSYYAVSVCFTGFMVPVLQKQGFNNSQIGILLGIRALLSVLAQPFFADYFQKTKRNFTLNHLIAGLIVMSMIMTGLQLFNPNFIGTTFIFVAYGIFTFGIISFIDAMSTLYFHEGKSVNYPIARGVGSLSYAVFALLVGFLVSPQAILTTQIILFIPLLYLVLTIDPIHKMEKGEETTTKESISLSRILKEYPVFKYFLLAVTIVFIGKEMTSNFLIDVYRSLGGDSKSYGVGTFILAMSEIPAAIIFTKIAGKLGVYKLILLSFFFASIRLLLIAIAPSLLVLNIAQAFQMLGYGLFWAGSVYFIREVLPAQYSVKAQAALGVCYMGIGSGVGSIASGFILSNTSLTTLLIVSTALSFVGTGVFLMGKKYYTKIS